MNEQAFWNRKTVIIVLISCLAFFFRVYRLPSVPPSPSLDEVSIGYNAYSILKTGADEYGTKFPLLLRAYDDWRPALYVYTVIPFVWLFGLTVTAVRLPSVILSMVTIVTTYFLAKELLTGMVNKQKAIGRSVQSLLFTVPLLSSLLLAISPWHIYLSRLGHEANLGLTLFVLAGYFFIRWTNQERSMSLSVSAVLFALSVGSYQSEKVVVPLMVLFLGVLYRQELLKHVRDTVIAVILGLLIVIPIVYGTVTSPGLIRLSATNAFTSGNPAYHESLNRFNAAKFRNDYVGQVLWNRRLVPVRIFVSQYLSHFSPVWLFSGNFRESHKVPNVGLLYPWELPLILIGIFIFLRMTHIRKGVLLLLLWLAIAPIPGALTTEAPHAMRSYTFLPVWQIFGAAGAVSLYLMFAFSKNIQRASVIGFVTLGGISLSLFYRQYFFVFPKTQSDSFQYALSDALIYTQKVQNSYNHIVISNENNLYQSYMFYLFTSRFDPEEYQKSGGTKSGGYAEEHTIGKYRFLPIGRNGNDPLHGTLFLVNASEIPQNAIILETFKNLDGINAIDAVRL